MGSDGLPAATAELEQALRRLGEEQFPHIFQPPAWPPPPKHLGVHHPYALGPVMPAPDDPSEEAFTKAAELDPVLRRVFEAGELGLQIRTSAGLGWAVQHQLLSSALLTSAARLHLARGGAANDRDAYLASLSETLADFRALLAGETVRGYMLIGFEGLSLAPGTRINTPWGEVRAATDEEMLVQPFASTPTMLLLLVEHPVRAETGQPNPRAKGSILHDVSFGNAAGKAARLLALATLLTLADEFVAARDVWHMAVLPGVEMIGMIGYGYGPMLPWRRRAEPLDERETYLWVTWMERLDAHDDPAIAVATRRILTAVRERSNAEDALIDAVIAWESLFGLSSGTTEVKFRVTASLARILEDALPNRKRLRSELGVIYDLRSRLVHGDQSKPRDGLDEKRDAAFRVAILALAFLFCERPDLIPNKRRADEILLG
jgi:hypothetical protein